MRFYDLKLAYSSSSIPQECQGGQALLERLATQERWGLLEAKV